MRLEREIELLPPQLRFIKAKEREVIYSGAFGAGKTRALCLKLASRVIGFPGSREGLARKHLVSLKSTTLRTLLESDGNLPPVLPLGSYTHNKSERTIKVHGGGTIYYFGLGDAEDYQKIGSLNLSGCAVDEAVELTEADWTMLRGRVRLKLDGQSMQLYGACNPGAPSHHLARRFGLAGGYKAADNCKAIQTRSPDNFFLPEEYVKDLMSLTGVAFERYVEGKWRGGEGLVFDRFDRSIHVREREEEWKRIVVGQDEGYTNPAALVVLGEDSDGRLHILEEWYRTNQLEEDVIKAAKDIASRYRVESFVVDPSAAKLRASMHSSDLPVTPADNEVFPGIQKVQQRLPRAGDGKPRLTVDPRCENLIREFESYEWLGGSSGFKDIPKKENDHALDALRYAVVYFDGSSIEPRVRVAGTEETGTRFEEERMWRTF
jgi:PBSX family phage terminase large subunit